MAVRVATRGRRRGGHGAARAAALLLSAVAVAALLAAASGGLGSPLWGSVALAQDGERGASGAGERRVGLDAADGRRAAILFLPAPERASERLLDELAERGLAAGLTSPTVGGYSPEQMLLDMSQGARLTGAAYDSLPGGLDLRVRDGFGRMEGWRSARKRARSAAGTVRPGLLAATIEQKGGRVAYAGVSEPPVPAVKAFEHGATVEQPVLRDEPEEEAAVAANRAGRVKRVSLGFPRSLAARALSLWRRADLLVSRLPPGDAGLRALDRMLAAAAPNDLVFVVQAPPPAMELLPTGVRERGVTGLITSETTRQPGLVAAPDATTTVLRHLGIEVPSSMQGQAVEPADGSARDLESLSSRLSVVSSRRGPVLVWALVGWAALLAGLALTWGRAGARTAVRAGLLAVLWMPALALLTAALRPSEAVEVAILAGGALALALATDRVVPWPAGPAIPAAATLVSHAVDLAAGSALIATSLAGPNPFGGARFFGIGNELEVILSVAVLLGTGAALAGAARGRPEAPPWAFAVACALAAIVIAAGQLGAAVGGVVTLAAGGGAAVLASLATRPSRRAVALAVAAPVLGLACLAAIDIATAGGAHFTREVIDGDDPADLLDTIRRRLDVSLSGLGRGGRGVAVAVAVMLLVTGVVKRRSLLAPLREVSPITARALRAGLLGTLAATVVGALANDSGPTMLLIGTALLGLAVAYVRAAPPGAAPGVN